MVTSAIKLAFCVVVIANLNAKRVFYREKKNKNQNIHIVFDILFYEFSQSIVAYVLNVLVVFGTKIKIVK